MANTTVNLTNYDLHNIALLACLEPTILDGLSFNISESPFLKSINASNCGVDEFGVNPDSGEFDAMKELHFVVLVVVLYVIVILLGGIGNCLVVLTIAKTRQMWTATNVFIANLAVADIFVCIFDLPVSVYYQLTDDWIFGKALCHVIPTMLAVVVYASTLTLTLIAIDRYLLIVCPMRKPLNVRLALVLVVAIAVVSIGVASPIAIYAQYITLDDAILNLYRRYCTERWPKKFHRFLYTTLTLIFQYFLPLILIGYLYFLIFRRVRQRMQTVKTCRKTKTTKMLVAVVTVFAIAWTPFHLFAVIGELNYTIVKGKYYKLIDALLRVVAMSSSCINPLLYGWLNDNYRNAFLSIIMRQHNRIKAIRQEDESTKKSHVVVSSPPNKVRTEPNGNCTTYTKEEQVPLTLLVGGNNGVTNSCVVMDEGDKEIIGSASV